MKGVHIGNYKKDSKSHGGWFLGVFMENAPRKTDKVEIKYWEYPKEGKTTHPTKISQTIECDVLLEGKIQGSIDGEQFTLSAGEYIVIAPGVKNNTAELILKSAKGITIKAPSDPKAKKIVV